MAAKRVEVAIVTFGPFKRFSILSQADAFQAPTLVTAGDTPMGAAVRQAVDLVTERKRPTELMASASIGPGYF